MSSRISSAPGYSENKFLPSSLTTNGLVFPSKEPAGIVCAYRRCRYEALLCRRGHGGGIRVLGPYLAKSLVVAKEKGLVLLDRAADASAKLILTQLGTPARSRKVVARIESVVAQILEKRTVESVRAGLRNNIGHASLCAGDFRRVQVGGDVDLLNGIDGGPDDNGAEVPFVVVHAVDHIVIEKVVLPVGGKGRGQTAVCAVISASSRVESSLGHACRELN